MKKLLLASAIAALSITAVQAAPTVYGKAFLTLDIKDGDDNSANANSRSALTSNASRIGLKGSEALTANTDVVYQLEYRVDVDDSRQQFTSRDTYLGLSNKELGTLVAGRLTAIDDYINYAKVVEGGVVGGNDVLSTLTGPRANNAFAYFSPDYQGVQFMGMYVLDEHKGAVTRSNPNRDSLGRDAFGIGAKYEPSNMPLKAGITYIKAGAEASNGTSFEQSVRGSVAYALNPALTLAGQVQVAEGISTDADGNLTSNKKQKETTFTVSGSYKVAQTPWTAYAQVDVVDNAAYIDNAERQRLAVGGKYNFNKNAIGHVYGAYMKSEGVDLAPTATSNKADAYGIGAGLEYKF